MPEETDPFESPHRRFLRDLLAALAYRYSEEGFLLASGQRSQEYLDCKAALGRPEAMAALGPAILDVLHPAVVAVGGLTMGADPLAMATSVASAASPRPVRWFAVRKAAKEHGRRKAIEGAWGAGDPVAVLDDVVTTGGSTLEAAARAREAGLVIRQVVVLVDREEGGLQRIQDELGSEVPVVALLRKSDVRSAWMAGQPHR